MSARFIPSKLVLVRVAKMASFVNCEMTGMHGDKHDEWIRAL